MFLDRDCQERKGTSALCLVLILYDFSNKLRMEAQVQNDTEKFLLPTSNAAERNLMLVANDTFAIHKVDSLWPVHFVDFSLAANQGNFIIIS